MGEYHKLLKIHNFWQILVTQRVLKKQLLKKDQEKISFFSNFIKDLNFADGGKGNLNLKIQEVSNDKYLKLYKLKTNLIDYNSQTLENSLDFTYENDDLFFGFNSSIYETLKKIIMIGMNIFTLI